MPVKKRKKYHVSPGGGIARTQTGEGSYYEFGTEGRLIKPGQTVFKRKTGKGTEIGIGVQPGHPAQTMVRGEGREFPSYALTPEEEEAEGVIKKKKEKRQEEITKRTAEEQEIVNLQVAAQYATPVQLRKIQERVKELLEPIEGVPEEAEEKKKKSLLTKTAELGLKPAELIGHGLLRGGEAISGKKFGRPTAEELAETGAGKALGLATVATGVALGVAAGAGIIARVAPNMAKFVAPKAAAGAGRLGIVKGAQAGRLATITRTKYAHQIVKGTLKGRGAISTQRVFNVSTKTTEALAKGLAGMSKVGARQVVSSGIGFLKTHKLAVGAWVGVQSMFTWLASDNILTGASMYARDAATNVRFGNYTVAEARAGLDQAQKDVNLAKTFVKVSIFTNPLIFPFGLLLLANARGAQRQIDLQRGLIDEYEMQGIGV